MLRRAPFILTAFVLCVLCLPSQPATAQGLIWGDLPKTGTWVKYEGEYQQVQIRQDRIDEDLDTDYKCLDPDDPDYVRPEHVLCWIRHLYLRSLASKMVMVDGKPTDCRVLEIKSITGTSIDGQLIAGPGGEKIYKVYVLPSTKFGKQVDADGVPVSYIPIVKGYRKIGQREVKRLTTGVLQVYPTLTLLSHYKSIEADGDTPEDLQIKLGQVSAKKHIGVNMMENTTSRSNSTATIWQSKEVPFGLAKWRVEVIREAKDAGQPRTAFSPATKVTVSMTAVETGTDATSEIDESSVPEPGNSE
jgi:hypothetical protein